MQSSIDKLESARVNAIEVRESFYKKLSQTTDFDEITLIQKEIRYREGVIRGLEQALTILFQEA